MPKLNCLCGSVIDLSISPHPDGFKLLSERSKDELADSLEALYKEAESEEVFARKLHRLLAPVPGPAPHMFQCHHCGRLAVFKRASDSLVSQWYFPERQHGALPPKLRALWDVESINDGENGTGVE